MNTYIFKSLCCVISIVGGLTLTSCNSDFLDTTPTDQVSSATIWTNSNLAVGAVNGIYERFYYEYINNPWDTQWDAYTEVMDEDVNWVSDNAPILMGNATASSGPFIYWWQIFYEEVSRANDVIANVNTVPDMSDADKGRYTAEAKFLRAWAYYRLNSLWQGVPIYTEPVLDGIADKPRNTAEEVWNQIIQDCTDAINEPNLPNKYSTSDANYGRVTKGAAYMLRAMAYMWLKDYANAEADYKTITTLGYSLFNDYKAMFKEANEKNDEYIFQYQYSTEVDHGNYLSWTFGNRVSAGSSWDNYMPNPAFVDTYEWADGKPFNMDDVIPGYSALTPNERSVYYLRDSMTTDEQGVMNTYGAKMSEYLPTGNEARILQVYTNRDPRMTENFITPYSQYVGGETGTALTYTLRWPYRGFDDAAPYDLRTDTNDRFYYLWRKYVFEGTEHTIQDDSPIDLPQMRYADALLGLAEALNEQGKTDEAIPYVNQVRQRAGVALLNSNEYTTVTGQDDLRQRIRNENGWELCGESTLYFKELRWGTWLNKKFTVGNGMTEIWGTKRYTNREIGDFITKWPLPQAEVQKNPNLIQNENWY